MEISCPVSSERINENVVRLIALMVAIIGAVSLLFVNFYAIVFLMIDFAIRAFTSGKFSLLKFIALKLFKLFSLPAKLTDLAPKKFAATLGFVFCLVIGAFYLFNQIYIAIALTTVLLLFAVLESVFAICVGCYVYSLWQSISKRK
ncbi:DUF4395 domain-containing protein [Pedobacter frigiditerrae]|nr:DUF4395 domain-containing protein [Pedobacter frigiditerrae]